MDIFGNLKSLFSALGRLAAAVNHSAELFEAANVALVDRLTTNDEPKALSSANGRRRPKDLKVSE